MYDLNELKEFKHLMLDIETMADESYASILSIGALEFDIDTGETGREFHVDIDLQSCLDIGLIMNGSTVLWWMQQNEEARNEITSKERIHILEALQMFSDFCNKDYEVWGRSPRFDCGILINAYNKAKMDIPWNVKKERCVRTLEFFYPEIKYNFPRIGVKHSPLDDCYHQVGYCTAIWKQLKQTK